MGNTAQQHWDGVYNSQSWDRVSWFRPHLETSLGFIERGAGGNPDASILDVGGGASTLADDLIARGYRNLTILDISQAALDAARRRMGASGDTVHWIRGDVTAKEFTVRHCDVWHDRAVFHFLTSRQERVAYMHNLVTAVRPGGHIIVSTFGPEGPAKCSGLDVARYDAEGLHHEFGARFRLVESTKELHETPEGIRQQFVYCYCTLGS